MIKVTPWLDWLLLTKRPENIAKMLPSDWNEGWDNVWLGTSAEDQERYDLRVGTLLSVKAKIHFISAEPLLGEITLRHGDKDGLNWIIVGGESGGNFREMDLKWARKLRNDSKRRGVVFFFKQHSGFQPKLKGKLLDGKKYQRWPKRRLTTGNSRLGRPKNSLLSRLEQLRLAQKVYRTKHAVIPIQKTKLEKIDKVAGPGRRTVFVNDAIDQALDLRLTR